MCVNFSLDLVETKEGEKVVQQAIQFGANDGYTQSIYVGVKEPSEILNDQLLNSTNFKLQCKGKHV